MAWKPIISRRSGGIVAVVAVLACLVALWQLSPLGAFADPERVARVIDGFRRSPWAPVTLGGLYLAATAVMFPVMAINLALVLVLGPLWGVLAALYGMLLAGLSAFLIGRRFGRRPLQGLDSPALDKTLRVVRDSGLPGMVLFRMVPVAPYPVVNLALGAGGIGIGVFTLGTALGVLPNLIAMGMIGVQLQSVFEDPNATTLGLLVAVILVYGALAWWVKRRLSGQLADT